MAGEARHLLEPPQQTDQEEDEGMVHIAPCQPPVLPVHLERAVVQCTTDVQAPVATEVGQRPIEGFASAGFQSLSIVSSPPTIRCRSFGLCFPST